MKIFIITFPLLLACIRSFIEIRSDFIIGLGWVVIGLWISSIGWAYRRQKDIPMVGPFGFKNGNNEPARKIAVVVMNVIFSIAVFFGK